MSLKYKKQQEIMTNKLSAEHLKQLLEEVVAVDFIYVFNKMSVVVERVVSVVFGNRAGDNLFAHKLPACVCEPSNGANVPDRS